MQNIQLLLNQSLTNYKVDLFSVHEHVQKLTDIISADRSSSEQVFNILMKDIKQYADDVGIEFVVPRITSKQTLRSNYPTNNPIDYYRMSVFLPYLDSLTFRFQKKMKMLFAYFLYIQKV